jgi:histidinol-phosphate aminotransferase
MTWSRRSFIRTVGAGSAALTMPWVSARGMEARVGTWAPAWSTAPEEGIRIDSNENPYGPAAEAIDAIREMLSEASRYPDFHPLGLVKAVAAHLQVPGDHILLGSGSGEVLKMAVDGLTSPTRGLVTAVPTFELPTNRARVLGVPCTEVPVDAALKLDLSAMADAAGSAGLVFLCNPNNPTGTVHSVDVVLAAVHRMLLASPDVYILVDEAYHEYVDDPSYASMLPLAMNEPRVLISRTFSKVYGLAGIRIGYAVGRPETLARLAKHRVENTVSVLAAAAGIGSLSASGHVPRAQVRNREAKAFTRSFFESAGYTVVPSETNFFMVDIRRDVRQFRATCTERGVRIGRPFPPLLTHARITIGTMEEMQAATAVFRDVLAAAAG